MIANSTIQSVISGWWRITETEVWADDVLDLLGPAMISFEGCGGRLRVLAILACLECKPTKTGVSFTWEGSSELDPISGTGTARVCRDGLLRGTLRIDHGDKSRFVAESEEAPVEPIGEPRVYERRR